MRARPIRFLPLAVFLLLAFAATNVSAQTYWFESYETAVDRIDDREQVESALALLDQLLADRPVPEAQVRIPGDRYVDYLPYFQKARIQSMLGQYDEARHNLDVSEAFGAVRNNRRAMSALQDLRAELNGR